MVVTIWFLLVLVLNGVAAIQLSVFFMEILILDLDIQLYKACDLFLHDVVCKEM